MQRLPRVNPQHLLQGPAREDIRPVMGGHNCKHHNVSLFDCTPRLKFSVSNWRIDQDPSLLEMFVGIICACMPAAANTCHRHLPSYDSLKKNLRVHYRLLGRKDRSTGPFFPESTSHAIKTSRSVHEGYVSLDAPQLPMPVPAKSPWTFINRGNTGKFDHDGIHRTYEMQQASTLPPTSTGQWTAV